MGFKELDTLNTTRGFKFVADPTRLSDEAVPQSRPDAQCQENP